MRCERPSSGTGRLSQPRCGTGRVFGRPDAELGAGVAQNRNWGNGAADARGEKNRAPRKWVHNGYASLTRR